jgi:type I restriction enzyme S subunit
MAIYASPTVGRLGILASEASFNQAAVGLFPKREICNSYFLFLKLFSMRDYFNGIARGAAQQNINVKIVKTAMSYFPEKSIIYRFSEIISPMFELIKILSRKNNSLIRTRNLLLPKLVSGQIDVSELDIDIN